ncbi:antitoxin [Nonomuraea pusilla]|uniref:MT0933-like antitoxin protein n=1 Tax=Nonomuraea pusilla TaxID=46177 RepID=A0A1H8GF15_9ACTN|nr:antitoxin [Nonomuraea pusilla]SEN42390.1 MT0933-like antitoxin protein [Nonomuraea pusilla]
MGRIGEWLKKAENLARGHSKQADELVDRAERFAKERTGHKYDEQIGKGADAVQRRYGGGRADRVADEPTAGPYTTDETDRRPPDEPPAARPR